MKRVLGQSAAASTITALTAAPCSATFWQHGIKPYETSFAIHSKTSKTLSDCDQNHSDHKMAISHCGQVLFWNVMMQAKQSIRDGKPRWNTAYCHEESPTDYRARIIRIFQMIAFELKENPNIAIISLQEAPINPQDVALVHDLIKAFFPSDWHIDTGNVTSDLSEWGVFTLINSQKLALQSIEQICLIGDVSAGQSLKPRCRSFQLTDESGKRFISSVHLPHDAPHQGFRLLLSQALSYMHTAYNGESVHFKFVGDWNIDKEDKLKIIQQTLLDFTQMQNELSNATKQPYQIIVTLEPSLEGHLKANGDKMTVDAVLSIELKPHHQYDFNITLSWQLLTALAYLCLLKCTYDFCFTGILTTIESAQKKTPQEAPNLVNQSV